jgi:hypothetical protein
MPRRTPPTPPIQAGLTNDIVAVTLTTDSMAYLNQIILPGTTGDSLIGNLKVNPAIKDLVTAIYQVFSGSSVGHTTKDATGLITAITLNPTGNLATANQYQTMEDACTAAINQINTALGARVAIEF